VARFVDPDSSREKIDAVVAEWARCCLVEDRSVLFDERTIWTVSNLEEFRRRFSDPGIGRGEESFELKLTRQLEDASADVRWLACELMAVYFLFARTAISGPGKRAALNAIADPIGEEQPPHWQRLMDAMDEGIGGPGLGYNVRRDAQISYLTDFAIRFKAIDTRAAREQLLEQPWTLREFADDASDGIPVREMRHILLHLLRPDEFERMSSRTHKQQIVNAFKSELLDGSGPEDLDEQLLAIRRRLAELDAQPDAYTGVLDFYYPPLRDIWDPGADRPDGAGDLDLIEYKRQIVLYGPPGTGKTHRTRELAERLIRRAALRAWRANRYFSSQTELSDLVEQNVRWVQLHAGYGYEEFVRGLRLAPDGSTTYVDGLLPRLVDEMNAAPEDDRLPVVLVLDEINRTDLSRLFGEAFSLLENRDAAVLLPGLDADGSARVLSLPKNLYVIGTMNLIDQSVEELDFALRRRFFWRPAGFDPAPIIDVNRQRWSEHAPARYRWNRAAGDMELLAERATLLNQQIAGSPHLGPQYELGHTYFFDAAFFAGRWLQGRRALSGGVLWTARGQPRSSLEDLWTFSLQPLLAQYLAGLESDTASAELDRLRAVLMSGNVQ
jgi:5-methylcytosine-specific restriction protein B